MWPAPFARFGRRASASVNTSSARSQSPDRTSTAPKIARHHDCTGMKRRRSRELDDRLAPLRRAVDVGEPVADHERRTAGVTTGERIARLAAEGDRHRFVQQRGALVHAPLAHERAAELCQRHALDVRMRDRERLASARRGLHGSPVRAWPPRSRATPARRPGAHPRAAAAPAPASPEDSASRPSMRYSPARYTATRPASCVRPARAYAAYASRRCSIAASRSPSHQRDWPRPSSASASRGAAANASRAPAQSACANRSQPSMEA